MPEVNRYTQMPAPLMVNPISFEEFARVPIMKVKAEAEAMDATNRILTNYNVDDKDLGYVSKLVSNIDKAKENVVTRITDEGINSQIVNDVIKLKRERDALYNSKIQQAEENKKRIDMWRQTVDQLYGKDSPAYASLVKKKELERWGGTFASGDNPQTFVGTYAPDYFDMKKDVFDYMKQASDMTQLNAKGANVFIPGGGPPKEVQIGNKIYGVTQNSYKKTTLTNEEKLALVYKNMWDEYRDPTTKRGQFKEYAEISDEELKYQLDQAFDAYKRTIVEEQGGGSSFSGGEKIKPVTPENQFVFGTPITSNSKIVDNIKVSTNILETTKELGQSLSTSKPFNFGKSPIRDLSGLVIPLSTTVFDVIEFFKNKPERTEDKLSVIKQHYRTLNKLGTNIDGSKNMSIANLYDKASKGDASATNLLYEKIQDNVKSTHNKVVEPKLYVGDWIKSLEGDDTKNKPVLAAEDLSVGNRKVLTYKSRENIGPKGLLRSSNEEDIYKEDIQQLLYQGKAKVGATLPFLSPLLRDKNNEHIEEMTGAYVVQLDTPEGIKTALVSRNDSDKQTPEYKRGNELEKLAFNLKASESSKLGDIYYYNSTNNKWEAGILTNDDSRNNTWVVQNAKGQDLGDLDLNLPVVGKEYFNTYVAPELNKQKIKK